MSSILIRNLTFAYGGFPPLFENVNLNFDTSWRLGLLGRNGRGKTTFLKILEGQLPFEGSVSSPHPFRYFPYPTASPSLNAYQLLESLSRDGRGFRLERETSLLKLPREALARPLSELSGGEAAKALLAILFLEDDAFPLIDEPTHNLDQDGRRVLGEYLRGKSGFVLVSHDRILLDQCVDHVLYINRRGIELENGNFSSYARNRALREQYEAARGEKLSKEINRLKAASQRSSQWAGKTEEGKYGNGPVDRGFIGHKAAKMQKRAKATEKRRGKALEEKAALSRNAEEGGRLSMNPLRHHGRILAWGKNLSIGYGAKSDLEGLSFTLNTGGVLAVRGPNGSGKSLLLSLLAGKARILGGEFHMAQNIKVSIVPQKLEPADTSLKDFSLSMDADYTKFLTVLRHLGFERGQLSASLRGLSQGQMKKALLAASLCAEAHLYLWDEPLGYIDIQSRLDIENLILESQPTMALAEHDQAFLEKVGTDFLDLGGPR
jgi:lincosamide and streptogramin A transport system ATP-binding/permease protein